MRRRFLSVMVCLVAICLLVVGGCDIPGMSLRGDYSSGDDWGGGSDEYHSGDDSYEENDTRSTAYFLPTNYVYAYQYDDDWYEIYVPSSDPYLGIVLNFVDDDGDIDVELYDSSGTAVASSIGVSDSEEIYYDTGYGGTYYIRVYLADMGNWYELFWDVTY